MIPLFTDPLATRAEGQRPRRSRRVLVSATADRGPAAAACARLVRSPGPEAVSGCLQPRRICRRCQQCEQMPPWRAWCLPPAAAARGPGCGDAWSVLLYAVTAAALQLKDTGMVVASSHRQRPVGAVVHARHASVTVPEPRKGEQL